MRCRSPSKRGSAFPLDQLADADVPLVIPVSVVVAGLRDVRRIVDGTVVNDQPIAVRAFVLAPGLPPSKQD